MSRSFLFDVTMSKCHISNESPKSADSKSVFIFSLSSIDGQQELILWHKFGCGFSNMPHLVTVYIMKCVKHGLLRITNMLFAPKLNYRNVQNFNQTYMLGWGNFRDFFKNLNLEISRWLPKNPKIVKKTPKAVCWIFQINQLLMKYSIEAHKNFTRCSL